MRKWPTIQCDSEDLQWEIEAAEEGKPAIPRVMMEAYTGGKLEVPRYNAPVVVELTGITQRRAKTPLLMSHDVNRIVGHSDSMIVRDGKLIVTGVASAENEFSRQVVASSQSGFPWQSSVGLRPTSKPTFVPAGKSIEANGRTHEGPLYFVSKSELRETSFVPIGADRDATASIAANDQESDMDLNATGDNQNTERQDAPPVAASETTNTDRQERFDVKAYYAEAADAARRVKAVQDKLGQWPDLVATALEEEWTDREIQMQADLQATRLARPTVNGKLVEGASTTDRERDAQLVEAALAIRMGVTPEELIAPGGALTPRERLNLLNGIKGMPEDVVAEATESYRNYGLQDAVEHFAREKGWSGRWKFDAGKGAIEAAFTNLTLPLTFGNTLNRALLAAYQQMELKWPRFAAPKSVNDFRQQTYFRVHGTGYWEKLQGTATLAHGQIEEGASYTAQAETWGQYLVLDRQSFVNDDVGSLNAIASAMTNYGVLAVEREAFRLLIANTGSFFHSNNANLLSGAGSAFGYEGLKAALNTFRAKKDRGVSKDRNVAPALDIMPRVLLVPAALDIDARQLMAQSMLALSPDASSSANALVPTVNVMAGMFDVVSSRYLQDTAIHSSASSASWYLMADPAGPVPAMLCAFLNGVQRPIIENVQPRADQLGVGFRGYVDFGVSFADVNGAIKNVGS